MAGVFGRSPIQKTNPRSGLPLSGWGALLFGLPFFAVGVFITLLTSGILKSDPGSAHAPVWVLGSTGAIFGLPGIYIMISGALRLTGNRRSAEAKRHRPHSPWLWDYPWLALGITESKQKELLPPIALAAFLGLFMVPFNWWAWGSGVGNLFVQGMTVFFDLIILMVAGNAFYKLFQFFKYGNSRLRFGDFPFFLGHPAQLTLENLPLDMEELKLTLRCVEEAFETRNTSEGKESVTVCYDRYHEVRTLSGSELPASGRLNLQWQLPADAELTSRLSDRPAWYWELEAEAETPGIDYQARFLLPVYAKP